MFMGDELATARLRDARISISFLIAITSFAALVIIVAGLLSTARAAEETPQPQTIEQLTNSGATPVTAPLVSSSAAPATRSHKAKEADEQIMSGLTMLLLALTGASALAIWRRRVKGLVTARAR
ncbi:hypothetical protein HGP14_14255 [Rhizobium sp. P32RR-XVIII]|uniref:hypothetical protein n=1 Tax=Rhizobium sp. P32RR-XVIII TaxID=2726738 RepID=UPI0014572892|nr:hypothetical protein [Rhizobium sp. P32RR-XVIII]NLS04516.1 hypothetical protein [Rhizobium sp. P32RR-XVIII]